MDLVLRAAQVLISMQERSEFCVPVPARFVGDESEGLQHSVESLAGVAGLVSGCCELFKVCGNLTPGRMARVSRGFRLCAGPSVEANLDGRRSNNGSPGGQGMMWGYGGYGSIWWMIAVQALIAAVVIAGSAFAVILLARRADPVVPLGANSPRSILEGRLARGEIDEQEFQRRSSLLIKP